MNLFQRIGNKIYSRDYALIIECEYIACPANKMKHCSMPSAIRISSGGRCLTGTQLIELERENKGSANPSFYKHEGD